MRIDHSIAKAEILTFIKEHNRKPSQKATNPEELLLAKRLNRFTSGRYSDQNLKALVSKIVPSRKDVESKKCLILDFIRTHKRLPGKREKRLYSAYYSYVIEGHNTYDPIFRDRVEELKAEYLIYSASDIQMQTKSQILTFIEIEKRRPNRHSSDLEERGLASTMYHYIGLLSPAYDPEFLKQVLSACPLPLCSIQKKLEILMFIESQGRVPWKSDVGINIDERAYTGYLNYMKLKSKAHDPEFRSHVLELIASKPRTL